MTVQYLLNANSQGVAPQQPDTPPSAASSAGSVFSGFSADNDNGGGAVNTRYDISSNLTLPTADASGVINHGSSGTHGGQQV